MTYAASGLKLVYVGGAISSGAGSVKNVYHYATNDTKATVEGTGYFDAKILDLNLGDIIEVSGDVDGTPFTVAYIVSSVTTHVGLTPAANLTFNAKYPISANIPLTDGTYAVGVATAAGTITDIRTALQGVITTNNAVLTFKIGSTAITSGVVTITQSGCAVGDMDSATPSAANTVAVGDVIMVVVSGTPGASKTAQATLVISPT